MGDVTPVRPWRWHCRACGESGQKGTRWGQVKAAAAHLNECGCPGDVPGHAQYGRMLFVWSFPPGLASHDEIGTRN